MVSTVLQKIMKYYEPVGCILNDLLADLSAQEMNASNVLSCNVSIH